VAGFLKVITITKSGNGISKYANMLKGCEGLRIKRIEQILMNNKTER
jgi:hypothetical protein